MKISIIGTGYVGLVTGTCFADLGNNVICLDTNESIIEGLSKAKIPFYEPGLEDLIKTNLTRGNIRFTSSYEDAISFAETIFICVGTPEDDKGSADLSFIQDVVIKISDHIKDKDRHLTVFIKSTVPSGTCSSVQDKFDELLQHSQSKVVVASNPEFLKEGSAVADFMKPDRIIVGTDDSNVSKLAERLYRPVNWKSNRLKVVSVEAAEIIKYSANAFLATKISFINEIAKLCDAVGADIAEVRTGVGLDPRIGNHFLYSGLGFGGSCFPKDVRALINTFTENSIDTKILKAVIEVNDNQLDYFISKIYSIYTPKELKKKTLCVWGLSFKPETDDIRESLGLKFINSISRQVKHINAYDPVAMTKAKESLSNIDNITFSKDSTEALEGADALVITTEWREFWNPDLEYLKVLKDQIIFDGRNILDKKLLEENEFSYFGIGR